MQHTGAAWTLAPLHFHRSWDRRHILPAVARPAEDTVLHHSQRTKQAAGEEKRSCSGDEEGVTFLEVHPWHYFDELSFLDGEAASVNKQQAPIRQLCV